MFARYISLTGITLLCFSATATAKLPNYNYIEASFITGEADADELGDIDQDGYRIDASASFIDDQLWVFASYGETDGDDDFNISGANQNVELEIESFLQAKFSRKYDIR